MAESKHNAIYDHFHALKASDLVACDKEVVTLKLDNTLDEAVDVLHKNKILSAPVLDDNSEIAGFLDMLDIAKYIVAAAPNDEDLKEDELKSLKVADRAIALIPVKSVANFSQSDAAVVLFKDSPATQVIELFASGVHRAVLTDDEKKIVGLISQSDIVRHLNENLHMGHLKEIGEKTLVDLGFAQTAIVTVKATSSVLHALKKMNKHQVSALAIVNDEHRLHGNFSASNLRGLYRQTLPEFLTSVEDFLTKHSPASLQSVCGQPTDSLITTTKTLVNEKLHHVWVVDDFKPVSIISLTDIMKIIVAQQ